MKFKLFFTALIISGITFSAFSQATSKDETQAIVDLLGIKKKQAIQKMVDITPKDSVNFWKVYNLYEQDVKKVRLQRINYYESLANSYSSMDAKKADEFAKKSFEIRKSQENLLEQYYGKMKTATNPVLALQFYQSETYLLTLARAHIMEQIPTYGQVMKSNKQ